jgi:hypothetical protein
MPSIREDMLSGDSRIPCKGFVRFGKGFSKAAWCEPSMACGLDFIHIIKSYTALDDARLGDREGETREWGEHMWSSARH